jgi:hypothetical protein
LSIKRIINNEIIDEEKIDYITGSICFNDGIEQYLLENNINNKSRVITILKDHP